MYEWVPNGREEDRGRHGDRCSQGEGRIIGSIRVSQRYFQAFWGFSWVISWERPCGSSWKTRSVFQGAVGAFCASTAPSASTGPVRGRQDGSQGGEPGVMSNWTAASSDCGRDDVHIRTADLYRPNARFTPERQRYQVLTPFGKLGYSRIISWIDLGDRGSQARTAPTSAGTDCGCALPATPAHRSGLRSRERHSPIPLPRG